MRYVLTIDGGGVRGIIPAIALARLERISGRPVRETFSFVAGTSTGAVLAAALAAGIPAERIVQLYLTRADEVFVQRPWNTLKRVVRGHMYSSRAIYRVLREEFGDQRDWTLNDSPIDLLITAKRLRDGAPWYFVRDSPRNSQRTGRLGLIDCVTASAAAPTLFDPWEITERPFTMPPGTTPIGVLVDGGVGVAGNPVYQACVEAFHYSEGYTPEQTCVVSFGTGRFQSLAHPSWIWPWLHWLLGELLRSPGEQQTELVQRHYAQMPLHRLDPDLRAFDPTLAGEIGLDDVDALPRLRQIGERFADQIDWPALLGGADTRFRITEDTTQTAEYQRFARP